MLSCASRFDFNPMLVFGFPFDNRPILHSLDLLHQHPARIREVIHFPGVHIAEIAFCDCIPFIFEEMKDPFRIPGPDVDIPLVNLPCTE
jgi:hypothetical protein